MSIALVTTVTIETTRSKADDKSDSVRDFFFILFAYPTAEPMGNPPDRLTPFSRAGAVTGIQ
jgi:hypothetical protein